MTTTVGRAALEGGLIPAFELERAGGGRLRLRALRGRRTPVLFFLHGAACVECLDLASAILPRYPDYALADAEPLLIVPGDITAAEELRRALASPLAVLADPDGAVARRYGVPAGGVALLVADRYGVPALWTGDANGHDLPDQDAIMREVEYLAHTCGAGCATPIWPDPDPAP